MSLHVGCKILQWLLFFQRQGAPREHNTYWHETCTAGAKPVTGQPSISSLWCCDHCPSGMLRAENPNECSCFGWQPRRKWNSQSKSMRTLGARRKPKTWSLRLNSRECSWKDIAIMALPWQEISDWNIEEDHPVLSNQMGQTPSRPLGAHPPGLRLRRWQQRQQQPRGGAVAGTAAGGISRNSFRQNFKLVKKALSFQNDNCYKFNLKFKSRFVSMKNMMSWVKSGLKSSKTPKVNKNFFTQKIKRLGHLDLHRQRQRGAPRRRGARRAAPGGLDRGFRRGAGGAEDGDGQLRPVWATDSWGNGTKPVGNLVINWEVKLENLREKCWHKADLD